MEEKEVEKPRCKNCSSTQTYLRLKTGERYCRNCGYVGKSELKKEKKGD